MSTAVVTIVAGRHRHLVNQQRGLCLGTRLPEIYVVVAMGDPAAIELTENGPLAGSDCLVLTRLLPVGEDLPLATARNTGAALALNAGADTVIFLDVDCIPSASLVETYTASIRGAARPALHCGVVRYLGPETDGAKLDVAVLHGRPHPARPDPAPGERLDADSWALFWSLSFAVSAATWGDLGGFHQEYVGYGAEDTDLSLLAHRRGIDLVWVGGADAFHQYHQTTKLPVAHLRDIVRNAGVFHRRWGLWPMEGWLRGFQDAGLAEYDPVLGWRVCR